MRRVCCSLLLLAACKEPSIDEYEPRNGIITGSVLYRVTPSMNPCTPPDVEGNVVVLLFAEDRLPPPQGTSGPVNFVVVPKETLFAGGPAADGLYSATFTMPSVPAGRYQIRAFLDSDSDFNPIYDLLAQTTAGDVGGGHVDANRRFLPVVVESEKETSQVTVLVASPIPVERPVFAHSSTTTFAVPYATPQRILLSSHPLDRAQVKASEQCTKFLVTYRDDDGDGVVDDQNGDHLPDLYPSVLFRRVPTADEPRTVLIPGIINPYPYLESLELQRAAGQQPALLVDLLEVILPPVAVVRGADGSTTFLPQVPPGEYDTVVIANTGQTWTVPNTLDAIQPGETDATQNVRVQMVPGAPLPTGAISGTLRVSQEQVGPAYVIAFRAEAPPPPQGSGRPVALGSVAATSFGASTGGIRSADFTISGLADGTYILGALMDLDGNFSPLVDLVAQPSAQDLLGGAASPVTVSNGGTTANVAVVLGGAVGFDRPAFEFEELTIPRTGFPRSFEIIAHAIPLLGHTSETVAVPVRLGTADADGDNFTDLLPRVVLTRMSDEGDPRIAPDHPSGVLIPGIVDPVPFVGPLANGAPAVPSQRYSVILPPVALQPDGQGGFTRLSPPPAGRYRVNVLSATGQTWSVPSNLDGQLGRTGAREDPTQSRVLRISESPIPGGVISGAISLMAPEPVDDYQVLVFAFDVTNLPPPHGAGRPVATALVPKAAFANQMATYQLGGLPTGTYQVRAFLDANDDFTAWFEPLSQPNTGDFGGGYLQLPQGTLRPVVVDALMPPVTGIDVTILQPARYSTDRPAFEIVPSDAVLDVGTGSVTVTVRGVTVQSSLHNVTGVFPISWVDLDASGVADDRDRNGLPDVYPLVVAELLDPQDPSNLTLHPDGVRIPGIVDARQFLRLGFPAGDPSAVQAVVVAPEVTVVFPAVAVTAAEPTRPIAPPAGRYRVTVVNPRGQTWTLPNTLQRAVATPFEATQGRYLTVRE